MSVVVIVWWQVFLAGYSQANDYQEALLLGSACGGATALSDDLAEAYLIKEVYQKLHVKCIE